MKHKKCLLLSFFLIISFLSLQFMAQDTITDISSLNTEDAGTYPVTFSYYDETTQTQKEKTVYITVIKPRTVQNKDIGEAIDANDIILKKGEIQELTDAQIIQITGAHAWNLSDGTEVPIVSVLVLAKDEKNGLYSVTFATQKGTETTIQILEMEENFLPADEEYINDISASKIIFYWGSILTFIICLILILLLGLYFYVQKKVNDVNELLYKYK